MPSAGTAREPAAPASLRERLFSLRDRILADPRFVRWATAFPPTRLVARRRARALFDLCGGFIYSQILVACVRLRVFEHLRAAPLTPAELAERTGLDPPGAERLMRAAAALRLLQRRGGEGRYGLGVLGAACLANPAVTAMVEHHSGIYGDFADPVALLRGELDTELRRLWTYAGGTGCGDADREKARAYTRLMEVSQPLVAREVLDAYPLRTAGLLVDVGGGSGAFALAAAARWPGLRALVLDLPDVAAQAQARIDASGLRARVSAVPCDFRREPLPSGADVVTLVRVLHDHDDEAALSLMRAARACLAAGGALVVAEPLADTAGAGPVGDAYFGFYLLAMGQGRPRSAREYALMLEQAGFSRVRSIPTHLPLVTGLIEARP